MGKVWTHPFTQNLASAALSTSFTIPKGVKMFKLLEVQVKFSAATTETVTITEDSYLGTTYDTVLETESLVAATSYVFKPDWVIALRYGDALAIACTKNNAVNIAYGHAKFEEM